MAFAYRKVEGLTELIRDLQNLPAELTAEAAGIVVYVADAVAEDVRAAYPPPSEDSVAGKTLRDGVRVSVVNAGRFGAVARVKSSAPHASLYENGTAARHTAKGYNRGAAPAKHVMVPIAVRARHGMYRSLAELLERRGATVTGL